jgi:hypothetical protein
MRLARSTYYDEPSGQPIEEARLVERIKEICAEWPCYGYRRVTAQLHAEGMLVNHKKAAAARQGGWKETGQHSKPLHEAWLLVAGTPSATVRASQEVRGALPGKEPINLGTSLCTPKAVKLKQFQRVAEEVMPAFR